MHKNDRLSFSSYLFSCYAFARDALLGWISSQNSHKSKELESNGSKANEPDPSLTKLLLTARVHYTRLTLEELPIGSITINEHGVIQNIDHWTERELGYGSAQLDGSSMSTLVDGEAFSLLRTINKAEIGSVWKIQLRRKHHESLKATMVLAESCEPHRYVFSIFYAVDL